MLCSFVGRATIWTAKNPLVQPSAIWFCEQVHSPKGRFFRKNKNVTKSQSVLQSTSWCNIPFFHPMKMMKSTCFHVNLNQVVIKFLSSPGRFRSIRVSPALRIKAIGSVLGKVSTSRWKQPSAETRVSHKFFSSHSGHPNPPHIHPFSLPIHISRASWMEYHMIMTIWIWMQIQVQAMSWCRIDRIVWSLDIWRALPPPLLLSQFPMNTWPPVCNTNWFQHAWKCDF